MRLTILFEDGDFDNFLKRNELLKELFEDAQKYTYIGKSISTPEYGIGCHKTKAGYVIKFVESERMTETTKMIKKLKNFWKWYRPIFMTRRKLFSLLVSSGVEQDKINDKFTWAAIRPVISSLEELKKNTWDKERVERIQQWLKENFEVTNDNH